MAWVKPKIRLDVMPGMRIKFNLKSRGKLFDGKVTRMTTTIVCHENGTTDVEVLYTVTAGMFYTVPFARIREVWQRGA